MTKPRIDDAQTALFLAIAQRHLEFEALKARGADRLDFRIVNCTAVDAALNEAYQAGLRAGQQAASRATRQ